jgi:hypothetical protein
MKFFKKKAVPIVTPLVATEIQQGNDSRSVYAHRKLSHHTVDVPDSSYMIDTPNRTFCQKCCTKENLKEQALLIATIASVLIGIGVGVGLRGLKCPTGKVL